MGAGASAEHKDDVRSRVKAVARLAASAHDADGAVAPARALLRTKPQSDACYLSEATGYLPGDAVLPLPDSHIVWEKMGARLQGLVTSGADVCKAMARMKLLSGSDMALPGRYLRRAATLLGCFAHAAWHFSRRPRSATLEDFLPPSVAEPWGEITRRLGRPFGQLTLLDYVSHNLSFRGPAAEDVPNLGAVEAAETFQKVKPDVTVFGNHAEELLILSVVDLQRTLANAMNSILHAQEEVMQSSPADVQKHLLHLRDHVEEMAACLRVITPDPTGRGSCDPSSYGKTVARLTAAVPQETVAAIHERFASLLPSLGVAAGSPTPVLDAVLGFSATEGSSAAELMGMHQHNWMPALHVQFIDALKMVSIRDFVAQNSDASLQAVFDAVVDSYAGEGGYLDTHRKLVHAYEEIASMVHSDRLPVSLQRPGVTVTRGGSVTVTGGISLPDETGEWMDMCTMLDEARCERYESTKIGAVFVAATLAHRAAVPSEDGESKASHLVLDVENHGVYFQPGDRCAVLANNDQQTTERMMQALGVHDNTFVELNERWLIGLAHRQKLPLTGPGSVPKLAIRDFLDAAVLSPLNHHVIAMLTELLVTSNFNEQHAVDEVAADMELWKVFAILSQLGVDLRVTVVPHLAYLLPPLTSRTYSICAAAQDDIPKDLHFTVGKAEVEDDDSEKWSEVMNYVYDSLRHTDELQTLAAEEQDQAELDDGENDDDPAARVQEDNQVVVNRALGKVMGTLTGMSSSSQLATEEENALRRAVLVSIRAVWDEWDLLSGQNVADPDDALNVLRPDQYQHEQAKRLPPVVQSDYDASRTGIGEAKEPTADLQFEEETVNYATADSAATFVHASEGTTVLSPRKERAVTRRAGLGSHFLHKSVQGDVIPVATRPVRHFRLPYNERRAPLIMIACGGGIATFRAFMEERMRLRNQRGVEVGEMWLLIGARSRAHLSYRAEIEHFVEEELLTVQVALSHEDYDFTCQLNHKGELDSRITEGSTHRSLKELLEDGDVQAKLWHWLQADAILYVAGQSGGIGIVRDAIAKAATAAIAKGADPSKAADPEFGTRYVKALVADSRIRMDATAAVLSAEVQEREPISISEVARHSHIGDFWFVYKSHVYDMSAVPEASVLYPSGLIGLLEKAGRDCTTSLSTANCHGTGTARTEGLMSAHSIAELACVYFDHDEDAERGLYLAWRDLMLLALQLRNVFRLEFNDPGTQLPCDLAQGLQGGHLLPSARAAAGQAPPARPMTALEDGLTHRKFWRLTLPLLAANIVEVAERTMPTFDKRGGAAIQTLTGIRDRMCKMLESSEMEFVSQWLSLPPKASAEHIAQFRKDFTALDLAWLDEVVVCAADGTEEIEKALAHTSNLEALMRRRIALICPELDAGFRKADHDNSGALNRAEMVQLLLDAGVEMDEIRIDSVMKKLDTNGDGKVSYEEFLTAMRVGEYSKQGKEGAVAGLEVVLPAKLNDMVTGLQRLVSKLGLAAMQYASRDDL